MKIRWAAAALLTLCASGACAQELPGTDCFSPGLAAVMEAYVTPLAMQLFM